MAYIKCSVARTGKVKVLEVELQPGDTLRFKPIAGDPWCANVVKPIRITALKIGPKASKNGIQGRITPTPCPEVRR